jgi:hypothetical protein
MAELQELRVARAIAAGISGAEPPPVFDGTGFCSVELGEGPAARVEGDSYATPEPIVAIAGPSAELSGEKHEFERERLTTGSVPDRPEPPSGLVPDTLVVQSSPKIEGMEVSGALSNPLASSVREALSANARANSGRFRRICRGYYELS